MTNNTAEKQQPITLDISKEDLADINEMLEQMTAQERVAWALDNLPDTHIVSSSFGAQSAVMLHMLTNRRGDGNLAAQRRDAERDGVMVTSFIQQSRRIKCWKCNEFGHAKNECPLLSKKEKKESEERLSCFSKNKDKETSFTGLQLRQKANSAFLDGYVEEDRLDLRVAWGSF